VLHAYQTADRYKSKLKLLHMTWDGGGWPVLDPTDLNRNDSVRLP
jgi:arabinan endo-1,5-alpha-L-arabinosidase